jgi:hypothetical protein
LEPEKFAQFFPKLTYEAECLHKAECLREIQRYSREIGFHAFQRAIENDRNEITVDDINYAIFKVRTRKRRMALPAMLGTLSLFQVGVVISLKDLLSLAHLFALLLFPTVTIIWILTTMKETRS